jgi:hypothetical protein
MNQILLGTSCDKYILRMIATTDVLSLEFASRARFTYLAVTLSTYVTVLLCCLQSRMENSFVITRIHDPLYHHTSVSKGGILVAVTA